MHKHAGGGFGYRARSSDRGCEWLHRVDRYSSADRLGISRSRRSSATQARSHRRLAVAPLNAVIAAGVLRDPVSRHPPPLRGIPVELSRSLWRPISLPGLPKPVWGSSRSCNSALPLTYCTKRYSAYQGGEKGGWKRGGCWGTSGRHRCQRAAAGTRTRVHQAADEGVAGRQRVLARYSIGTVDNSRQEVAMRSELKVRGPMLHEDI